MAVGFGVACPKPAKTRKQVKGRKDRREAKVNKSVRAQCVDRDGECRLQIVVDDKNVIWPMELCIGKSEWAHLGTKKRFKTRGQAADQRHSTWGSLMFCARHHRDYDRARLVI